MSCVRLLSHECRIKDFKASLSMSMSSSMSMSIWIDQRAGEGGNEQPLPLKDEMVEVAVKPPPPSTLPDPFFRRVADGARIVRLPQSSVHTVVSKFILW